MGNWFRLINLELYLLDFDNFELLTENIHQQE